MPPKVIRASRLDSRKSLAIDSELYGSPSNQDSDLSTNTLLNKNSRSSTTLTTTTTTVGTTASSKNASNGKVLPVRRSKRFSTESNESNESPAPNFVHQTTKRIKTVQGSPTRETSKVIKSKKGKEVKGSTTMSKSKSKGEVEIEQEDEDLEMEQDEERLPVKGSSLPSGKDKNNKKSKLNTGLSSSTGPPMPRGMERLGKPTKAQPLYDQVLEDGDEGGFPYTTNPPTPAPVRTKRVATAPKENPRQKNSRTTTLNSFDSDTSPSQPVPSTSRLSPEYSPARGSNTMAPIYTAETPKQMRNLALRGQGTASGTPGSAGRRGSVDRNRGKRASQIGNGQEALPHPDVKIDTFFRLLDPLDPYTHRMRSLIRWTAHRQRDTMFPSTSSNGSRTLSLSANDLLAKQVIDEFIGGISDRTISVNAEPSRDSRATSVPHVLLQQHEGNGKNRELYKHLLEDFDEIELEDSHRQVVVAQYDKFLNDHSNILAKAAAKPSPTIDQLAISAEDSYTGPKSMEEALALGKALMAGNGDLKTGYRKLGIVPAIIKGKGKGRELVGGEQLPEEDILKDQLAGIPLQSAHFKLLAHRLSTFTSLSSTYVETRTQQTHQALSEIAQQGLLSSTLVNSSTSNTISSNDPDYRGGIATVVKNFRGSRNAGSSPSSSSMSSSSKAVGGAAVVNQSMDMRDLLRAIVIADTRR